MFSPGFPIQKRKKRRVHPQVAGDDKAEILQHSIGSRPLTEPLGSSPLKMNSWWDEYYLDGGLEHFLFFHILGMSSFQLTNIFQTGWNHQPVIEMVDYITIVNSY